MKKLLLVYILSVPVLLSAQKVPLSPAEKYVLSTVIEQSPAIRDSTKNGKRITYFSDSLVWYNGSDSLNPETSDVTKMWFRENEIQVTRIRFDYRSDDEDKWEGHYNITLFDSTGRIISWKYVFKDSVFSAYNYYYSDRGALQKEESFKDGESRFAYWSYPDSLTAIKSGVKSPKPKEGNEGVFRVNLLGKIEEIKWFDGRGSEELASHYTYDERGNLLREEQKQPYQPTYIKQQKFDTRDRLIAECWGGKEKRYVYDENDSIVRTVSVVLGDSTWCSCVFEECEKKCLAKGIYGKYRTVTLYNEQGKLFFIGYTSYDDSEYSTFYETTIRTYTASGKPLSLVASNKHNERSSTITWTYSSDELRWIERYRIGDQPMSVRYVEYRY